MRLPLPVFRALVTFFAIVVGVFPTLQAAPDESAADENTWVLLASAKEPDGKEYLLQADVSEKTADIIIAHAREIDAALDKLNEDIRRDICSDKVFYLGAPEHLANKIDETAEVYASARASLIEALFTKLDEDDAAKVRKFKDQNIHVTLLARPERYGDPIRYGQHKPQNAINAICGE
jgi:hypothetical protein